MQSCYEYRKRARLALDGNIFSNTWLYALLVVLIVGALEGALGATAVGTIIVMGPLSFGLSVFFLDVVRGNEKKNDLGTMFNGFTSDFGGNLLLGLLQTLFISLWSLLFIIPGIIKALAYSMSFYIKADHPDYDWRRCLDESRQMMKGKKMKLFLLVLSFIGWYIVGAICLGIGTLWVEAYKNAAITCFYEDAKNA